MGNIVSTKASYDDWFELYDSRTGNLENLDLIPNYKSVYGDFWYEIKIDLKFVGTSLKDLKDFEMRIKQVFEAPSESLNRPETDQR